MAVPTRRAAFPYGRLICVQSPGQDSGHHPRNLGSATVHGRSGASRRSDRRGKHCLVYVTDQRIVATEFAGR